MCKACWEWTVLPPGLVLTAPHEAWSPISGLSRHVAVVILALVCVGYIWRPMRDTKSSVCGNCCDARGRLLVPFLVVFLALVVVSAGKGAWSSPSVTTWVGFASNMAENAETQTGGISAAEVGRKRRIAAQGWLTRASKKLETVVAQPEIDMSELLDAIEQFDSRLTAYDSAQSEFELYLDSDQLIAEIDKSADYRDNVRVPRIAASKLFASPIQNDDKHSDHVGSNASSSHVDVKLPKLNLPCFGGDVREWTSFWEQFEIAIDDSDLPDVSKFTYLRSLLKSDAKQCIEGLSLSGVHYSTACDLLKNRYGRPEQIIFTHVQDLLNLSIPAKCSVKQLWQLNDELLAHVRSLESLGVSGTQYGVILTPVIVSRLPEDIRLEWARKGAGHESDLKWLLTFLESDIKCRERSQVYEDKVSSAAPQVREERVKVTASTASALQSSSSSGRGCLVCGKNHATERCFKLTRVSFNECRELLRSHGLCYRCLGKGHIARGCASTCARCNGRHHRVLCLRGDNAKHGDSGQPQDTRELNVSDSSTSQSNVAVNENNDTSVKSGTATAHSSASLSVLGATTQNRYRVLLQTLRVTVRGGRVVDDVTILLDTGCDRSYISSALVRRVEPRWVESQMLSYAPFGSKESGKCALRNVFSLDLLGTSKNHPLLVTEVPVICAPMHRSEVREELLESFGALGFADGVLDVGDIQPDILIGLDQYHRFVKPSIVSSDPEGLFAQASVFGWILFGSFTSPSTGFAGCAVSHQLFCVERQLDGIVPELWSLEAIGISPGKEELVDPVLSSFKKDVAFTGGRYVTGLPWKKGSKYRLLDNEKLARKRLCNLNHKLSGNPDLKARYDGVFQQMLDSGVIEKVPLEEIECSRPKFYMPHRPVVREDKLTTKVRPVFDASARGYNQVSLNDCMEVGPCLLSNLTEILVRFRRWPVAVTADIEKAFHQISILEEDRDVHRFLWQPDDDVMTMRFTRVPFGNCCSPFLLNATIQHHLSSFPPSPAVNELQDNLYVDDFLSGADSEAESGALIRDSISIMDEAGMSLSKWCSNSSSVADLLEHEFDNKFLTADSVKVLGMRWLAEEDCFTFECIGLPEGLVITKRVILSYISRVFDPLGLLTPFTMMSKCLFQELWKTGVGWDEEIPVQFVKRFQMWMNDLSLLQMWKIPRSYFPVAWRDLQQLQLEGFGDASSTGYGACVYLRAQMPDGTYTSSLVMSKARVAPVKAMTIPRLELLGSLLCARLVSFVHKALKRPDVSIRCWTDSMVALCWIRGSPSKWKQFVANRVREIQDLTDPSQWFHCCGELNPADLVSRGLGAEELMSSELWMKGPEFLVYPGTEPCDPVEVARGSVLSSVSQDVAESPFVSVGFDTVTPEVLPVSRWGTLCKAIRVVAWVRRFVRNARSSVSERVKGELSFVELEKAKMVLIQQVQCGDFPEECASLQDGRPVKKSSPLYKFQPFLDGEGIMRVGGRLQFSDLSYDSKHPILIPKSHLAVLLVRFQHQLLKHGGVDVLLTSLRNQFWIVGARALAKQVKKRCLPCQKQDATASSQLAAPLPAVRVRPAEPFAVTGVDHAGPLYCCDQPGKKLYVLLFTCGVVRAVHLELVSFLSSPETLMAFRRFVARRGVPRNVFSDNAKGFKAMPDLLMKQFEHVSPEWTWIVPDSPWWGGWWERLVRSVKTALRKSVGVNSLTHTELVTVLVEIEACINSRPLTFVGDDIEAREPLTPAHFLLGRSGGFYSRASEETSPDPESLGLRWQLCQSVLQQFWSEWSTNYIRNLPQVAGSVKGGQVRVGSLVLVQGETRHRLSWPIGVVKQVFPGRDGVVRAAEIKTSKGLLTCSIQRLHVLEIASDIRDHASVARLGLQEDSPPADATDMTWVGESPLQS